jgi:hypothetical protein
MTRSTAFFVNGGAGRHLCSIPAFEKYEAENPDDDFVIICEGGMDMYKGHPTLHSRAFDNWHKNLFKDYIKDRNCVTTEPYRIWEYYNQKASLAQAFDIEINKQGIRELPAPFLKMSTQEDIDGYNLVEEVKEKTGKNKAIVFQPFGRSIMPMGKMLVDPGGRSFSQTHAVQLIKKIQKKYAVIVMAEMQIDWKEAGCADPVAQPEGAPIRAWTGFINAADGFVGCDSVGQHMAYALGTPAIAVLGSTFPENVSYPDTDKYQCLDIGEGRRVYDPIRISMEEEIHRKSDGLMLMNDKVIDEIYKELEVIMNKGAKNGK